jgi:hypothetical protein
MKFEELKLKEIKKALGFKSASMRYHNKNKSGGNFGTNLTKGTWGQPDWKNFEISGNYRLDGTLYDVSFGNAFQCGSNIREIDNIDLNKLIELIKRYMELEDELRKNK